MSAKAEEARGMRGSKTRARSRSGDPSEQWADNSACRSRSRPPRGGRPRAGVSQRQKGGGGRGCWCLLLPCSLSPPPFCSFLADPQKESLRPRGAGRKQGLPLDRAHPASHSRSGPGLARGGRGKLDGVFFSFHRRSSFSAPVARERETQRTDDWDLRSIDILSDKGGMKENKQGNQRWRSENRRAER